MNSEFKNEGPDPVLTEGKMKKILYDIHFVEAMRNDVGLKSDSFAFETMDEYYSTILKSHDVAMADFEQSFEHYIAYPKKMESIMSQVSDSLHAAGNLPKK